MVDVVEHHLAAPHVLLLLEYSYLLSLTLYTPERM